MPNTSPKLTATLAENRKYQICLAAVRPALPTAKSAEGIRNSADDRRAGISGNPENRRHRPPAAAWQEKLETPAPHRQASVRLRADSRQTQHSRNHVPFVRRGAGSRHVETGSLNADENATPTLAKC